MQEGSIKKHCVLLILCFILYTVVDVPHINDAKRFVEYIFRHFICTSLVILLLSEEKASLVKIFINFYAGVLLFSTIIYVLVILGMPIYSYQVSINDPYYSWGFSNSLFLILPITSFPFPRFQSIFFRARSSWYDFIFNVIYDKVQYEVMARYNYFSVFIVVNVISCIYAIVLGNGYL